MLGPLPRLYRVLVAAAVLLVFVGAGAWAAYTLPYPVLVGVGASVGLALGGVMAYLLVRSPGSATEHRQGRRHHVD